MNRIKVPANLNLDVCDASGTFVPIVKVRSGIGDPPRSPYSDEELSQIVKEPARPLSEIWKSLGRIN